MRAVTDTNILISAVIRPRGRLGWILARLEDGTYTLVTSTVLLEELIDVLGRPYFRNRYGVRGEQVSTLEAFLRRQGELVIPTRRIIACRDPKDDRVLEAAIAGRADVIVSGDQDLLVLGRFEGIPIVSPSEFRAMLRGEKSESE